VFAPEGNPVYPGEPGGKYFPIKNKIEREYRTVYNKQNVRN
jgi:hypothetical protein